MEETPHDPHSFRAGSVMPRRLPNFLLFPLFGQSRWGHSRQFQSGCTGQRGPTRKLRQFCYAHLRALELRVMHTSTIVSQAVRVLAALPPIRLTVYRRDAE